jgi:membrane protease YdiL (CAAX protease family)
VKKAFQIRFEEDVLKSIDKRDGFYSLIVYVYYMVMIFLYAMLLFKTDLYDNLSGYFSSKTFFRFLFYIPDTVVNLLPVFLILLFRRQSIRTIGMKKKHIGKSILIGVVGSIPFSIMNMIGPISSGKSLNPNPMDWLWSFLYFLICIAFAEEVVFRGFLQTRIFGLIKNKWAGIVIVGILFALMHVPFQMVKANMTPINFLLYDLRHLITTAVIHIYLAYLYTRDNNILAPTIAHAITNFSYEIFI